VKGIKLEPETIQNFDQKKSKGNILSQIPLYKKITEFVRKCFWGNFLSHLERFFFSFGAICFANFSIFLGKF
jgi:hypothetical protein